MVWIIVVILLILWRLGFFGESPSPSFPKTLGLTVGFLLALPASFHLISPHSPSTFRSLSQTPHTVAPRPPRSGH
jgi:hypothetical protein